MTAPLANVQWTRWLPLLATVIALGTVLVRFDTPVADVALTIVYYGLMVALPGTLLWRMIGIRSVSLVEDIAMGAAVGLAVQVTVRWILSQVGLSQFTALWIVPVLVISLLPRGRHLWRNKATSVTPRATAWTIAIIVVLVAWWVANTGFRFNRLAPVPGAAGEYYSMTPYKDMPFHQSLAWAVDSPQPTSYPNVAGVPLRYTLMVYEHLADLRQWTGADLTVVVERLWVLPLLALFVVFCATLTSRLAGSGRWGGLGAALAMFSAPLALYGWMHTQAPFYDTGTLTIGTLYSPTQSFGEPLFFALLTVVCALLPSIRRINLRIIALIALLGFASAGSKATFIPLLLCGLALAAIVTLLVRRRIAWFAVATGALLMVGMVAALYLITGTNSRDLQLSNGRQLVSRMPISGLLGNVSETKYFAAALAILAAAWAASAAGTYFLFRRRSRDLRLWFVVGVVVAGGAAAILASHPGLSQLYFLRSVWPLAGVLSAWGLAVGTRRTALSPNLRLSAVAVAGSLGLAAALFVWLSTRGWSPTPGWSGLLHLLAPIAAFAIAALLISLLVARLPWKRAKGARASRRPLVAVLLVAALVGGSLAQQLINRSLLPPPWAATTSPAQGPEVTADGAEAARYIRDHSQPGDVVATNAHCVGGGDPLGACDARHIWIAGLLERQVLVEGWWFTTPSADVAPGYTGMGPFWDPTLMRLNDAAFGPSSGTAIPELAEDDGVRWLLVDRTIGHEDPSVRKHATLVLDLPDAAVYRVTAPQS